MPNLYSIQFEIIPAQGCTILEVTKELQNRVSAWVATKYSRLWNAVCTFPIPNETAEPLPGHRIFHNLRKAGTGLLLRVRWIHPDEQDSSMRWTTDLTLAGLDDRLQLALRVGVVSTNFVIQPARLTVGRPRIVSDILSDYSCWVGPRPILPHKQIVQSSDVQTFVNEVLLDQKRSLPVVVVSHDRFKDAAIVDPDGLQNTLLGFAHVAVFDKWAAFKLTDNLGKALSCYNGCVRIYWPGLTRTADPLQHELYFPIQIEKFEASGKPLERRLFDFLAKVSAFRFAEGDLIRKIKSRIGAEQLAEDERTRKQIQQGGQDARTLQELQPVYELALEENESLLKRVSKLERENSELTTELASAKSNWAFYQEYQALNAGEEVHATEEAQELEFHSVRAALDQAEIDFNQELLILENAKDSATKSEFARPEQVYEALMAIREVGNIYFDSVRNSTSMGTWADQLGLRGFLQYSQTESETVKNDHRKYGRYREFVLNGSKRKIYQHLDLGGGDRKNCLQIYFEADRNLSRVIIAHCGEHLPFPGQRT